MRKVRDVDAVLNATFSVEGDGDRLAMTIESRSGARRSPTARNPDYDPALEVLLARLGALGARILDAQVFSITALRDYPDPDHRRLEVAGGYPVAVALHEPLELRRAFARAQRKVARAPDLTSSGNNNKRVRFWIDVPGWTPADARALEKELAGDPARAVPRAQSGAARGESRRGGDENTSENRRGQGYVSDPVVRRAVELHAMQMAAARFSGDGWTVENTSAHHPYDLRCRRGVEELRVEVKGTTGQGQEIHLTAGEVEHARANKEMVALFVVSAITVAPRDDGDVVASGGTARLLIPWDVDAGDLRAIAYDWRPSP